MRACSVYVIVIYGETSTRWPALSEEEQVGENVAYYAKMTANKVTGTGKNTTDHSDKVKERPAH